MSSPTVSKENDPVISEPLPLISEVSDLVQRTFIRRDYTYDETVTCITCINNVRPVLQRGHPMCGLIALTMADELMTGSIRTNAEPLALLMYSQSNGYTKQGEVLSSRYLLSLAKETLSCKGDIILSTDVTPNMLLDWIISRYPILIPYDCDKDHTPCLGSGHYAHWCLVVGVTFPLKNDLPILKELISYCNEVSSYPKHYLLQASEKLKTLIQTPSLFDVLLKCDNVHVFARHGKSRHLSLWRLDQLLASAGNLRELGPQRSYGNYVLPDCGLEESLCSQIVLLYC